MRIAIKDLETRVAYLNDLLRLKNGDKAVLDGAYGGWKVIVETPNHCVSDELTSGGFDTKRNVYNEVTAMINTLRFNAREV